MTSTEFTAGDTTPQPDVAPPRRQIGQRVEVHFADRSFEVLCLNPDRLAYEKVARARQWGTPQASPNQAMTFLTWSAAKRARLTELKFEEWEAQLLDYENITGDPEDAADPTPPAA